MQHQHKVSRVSIAKAIEATLIPGVRQAVVFQHPYLVVKATRRGKPDKRHRHTELVVTMGRPAYHERQMIKTMLKAGEPFPVRRVHLHWYPAKKK